MENLIFTLAISSTYSLSVLFHSLYIQTFSSDFIDQSNFTLSGVIAELTPKVYESSQL